MTASFVNALAQEGRLGEFADQLRSGFISQGFDSSLAPDPHAYAEMANLDKLVPRALEIADGDFSLLDRAFSTREIQELVRRTEGGSRRMADPTEVKQDEYLRGVRAALHSPRWQSRWNEK